MPPPAKKVLIITRDFAPYCPNPGWMVRCVTLANFLARNGFETYVLATKRAEKWPLLEIHPSVHVNWIRGFGEFFNEKPRIAAFRLPYIATKLLRVFARRIGLKSVIDVTSLDADAYKRKSLRIIRDHKIRNVIVSSPPHSLQLVGLEIKSLLGEKLNLIADFRDPWLLRQLYRPRGENALMFVQELERKVLVSADSVSMVSSGMIARYREIVDRGDRMLLVENGYDDDVPHIPPSDDFMSRVQAARRAGKIILGFFGSGAIGNPTHTKNLSGFLDSIAADTKLAAGVMVVLFGNIRVRAGALEDFGGLEVYVGETVSNAQARANMRELDVGLVIYTDSYDAELAMGGKIYDYAASGIPIWFVVPKQATSIRTFVSRSRKPFISDSACPQETRTTLGAILKEKAEQSLLQRSFSETEISSFSRSAQYQKFIAVLK